jgi:hypothetical protein
MRVCQGSRRKTPAHGAWSHGAAWDLGPQLSALTPPPDLGPVFPFPRKGPEGEGGGRAPW